jgi:hypothetical protein
MEEALNLGAMLSHPEAIMWDERKKNFLYVFPSPGEPKDKRGNSRDKSKVAVTVDCRDKVVDVSGKRKKVTMTTIRTAGTVNGGDIYKNRNYTQIWP